MAGEPQRVGLCGLSLMEDTASGVSRVSPWEAQEAQPIPQRVCCWEFSPRATPRQAEGDVDKEVCKRDAGRQE